MNTKSKLISTTVVFVSLLAPIIIQAQEEHHLKKNEVCVVHGKKIKASFSEECLQRYGKILNNKEHLKKTQECIVGGQEKFSIHRIGECFKQHGEIFNIP